MPWTNVDLDNGYLTASTQIVQLGWATEHAAPKSDSEGVIALDGGTVDVLREHRERQQQEARSTQRCGSAPVSSSPARTAPSSTPSWSAAPSIGLSGMPTSRRSGFTTYGMARPLLP